MQLVDGKGSKNSYFFLLFLFLLLLVVCGLEKLAFGRVTFNLQLSLALLSLHNVSVVHVPMALIVAWSFNLRCLTLQHH